MRPGQARFLRFAQVGESEIDDLVDALAWREFVRDDVGRFQVAMDDAEVVRKLEGGAKRRHDRLHLRETHSPLGRELVLHRRPVEQLHHQKGMILIVYVEVEN